MLARWHIYHIGLQARMARDLAKSSQPHKQHHHLQEYHYTTVNQALCSINNKASFQVSILLCQSPFSKIQTFNTISYQLHKNK